MPLRFQRGTIYKINRIYFLFLKSMYMLYLIWQIIQDVLKSEWWLNIESYLVTFLSLQFGAMYLFTLNIGTWY